MMEVGSNWRFYRWTAFVVFFVSGFAALLYQVIWQRLLVYFSGIDVYSVTLVVTAFMAGLGLGNLAGGHLADRLSRRLSLVMFVLAELAISLFGLLSKSFYYDFLYSRHAGLAQSGLLLWTILFFSLLWPTFFMGISLPVLAKALTPDVRAAAPTIGGLYGANTLGAAVGAFMTSWILLPNLGLAQSLFVGVALNLTCAIVLSLLLLAREPLVEAASVPSDSPMPDLSEPSGFSFIAWLSLYFLSGFIALSLEILWLRLLGVTLKSTAFAFGTVLAIYLGGMGVGAMLGTRLVSRSLRPARGFLLFEALVAAFAGLAVAIFISSVAGSTIPSLFDYLGDPDDLDLSVVLKHISDWWHHQTLSPEVATEIWQFVFLFGIVPVGLIFPSTFLMGLAFSFLQKAVQRDLARIGRRLGALQLANIVGAMAGTLLTGLALLNLFGTALTLKIVTAAGAIFAALWVWKVFKTRIGSFAVGAVFALLLFVCVPSSQLLWSRLHGAAPDQVVFAEDSSGVSLMRHNGPGSFPYVTVFVNGVGHSWLPYGDIHSVLGALPLMVHPNPRTVAVIGLGSGDTVFSSGGRPEIQSLLCVEILKPQLANLRETNKIYPDAGVTKFLQDQRVRNIAGDGRAWLMYNDSRFDIIEADALRPTSAYAGNVFSREYFQLLREHLNPGGFAVTWIPTTRVHETFLSVFPHVLRFDNVDIGSLEPISFDRAKVLELAGSPFVRDYFAAVGIDVERMMNDYTRPGKTIIYGPEAPRAGSDKINTDLFPRDEFNYRGPAK